MTADRTRSKVPPEVLDAAVSLVNALAANTEFRARIAAEEIARQVEAGTLIPIERLTVAPGLELVPAGRLPELEQAAKRVVKAWLDIPGEQGWTDEEVVLSRAVKGLAALFKELVEGDDEAAPDDDVNEHVADEQEDVDEPVAEAPEPATSENDDSAASDEVAEPEQPAPATSGKPAEMPDVDDHGPCDSCGAAIEEDEQARLSWILTRRKLCRTCHVGGQPAAQPEEKPDGAAGDT